MCDGKLASKRDVVILSIKPKRPDYPSSQKVVPVSELLQEWDKLDAYYRGQLLKLTKSFTKSAQAQKDHCNSKHQHQKNSRHSSPNSNKVSNKHSNHHNSNSAKSFPVNKKHSSSLSSDQFTELFGDENLFSPAASDTNNNNRHNNHRNQHHHHHNSQHSANKNSKLLHTRSLNSLFDDDDESLENDLLPAPPPSSRSRSISNSTNNSRKSSLSSVNGNLVVSIPVLAVQHSRDNDCFNRCGKNNKHLSKYFSDEEDNETSGVSEDEHDDDPDNEYDEPDNFLSVPRDNFQVQYGTKQKTRVALLENPGSVSPRFIVPIRVAPYKPPAAQGLNGVQIQKILYHKNDKVNYASPTTTTARTPDKPPDNNNSLSSLSPLVSLPKSAKVSSENNSPVSTVSPRSISGTTITVTPPPPHSDNNNATPKQAASQSPPDLSSPKSDQGYKSSSSTSSSSSSSAKLSSPPVNSTTGNHQQQKLKRPISLTENYSSSFSSSNSSSSSSGYGKKQRLGSSGSSDSAYSDRSPSSGYNFLPVTSSNYAFSTLSTASSLSSSTSSLNGDTFMENDHHSPSQRSRHSSNSSSASITSSRFSATTDNANETSGKSSFSSNGSPPAPTTNNYGSNKQKLNIINKNPSFVKPPSSITNNSSSSSSSAGDHSVFLAPAAVSITDRIIKKASRPQPELVERQRRRRLESNQRKSYALQKGDEHEERESIDLSMKSFEMIWNVPLLSPLRSP